MNELLNKLIFVFREVYETWCLRVGPTLDKAHLDLLQPIFNDIQLYPSEAQGRICIVVSTIEEIYEFLHNKSYCYGSHAFKFSQHFMY